MFKAWNKRDIALAWFHDFFQVVFKKKIMVQNLKEKSKQHKKLYFLNQKLGKVTVISVPLYGVPFVCISRDK